MGCRQDCVRVQGHRGPCMNESTWSAIDAVTPVERRSSTEPTLPHFTHYTKTFRRVSLDGSPAVVESVDQGEEIVRSSNPPNADLVPCPTCGAGRMDPCVVLEGSLQGQSFTNFFHRLRRERAALVALDEALDTLTK